MDEVISWGIHNFKESGAQVLSVEQEEVQKSPSFIHYNVMHSKLGRRRLHSIYTTSIYPHTHTHTHTHTYNPTLDHTPSHL